MRSASAGRCAWPALTSLAAALGLAGGALEAGEVAAKPAAFASPEAAGEEHALRALLEDYVRAIEQKDLRLFRTIKPDLSAEEERRIQKGFEAVQSQVIVMTIQSVELRAAEATIRVARRDTLNGSIVSSFPQSFFLARGKQGWSIREIGR